MDSPRELFNPRQSLQSRRVFGRGFSKTTLEPALSFDGPRLSVFQLDSSPSPQDYAIPRRTESYDGEASPLIKPSGSVSNAPVYTKRHTGGQDFWESVTGYDEEDDQEDTRDSSSRKQARTSSSASSPRQKSPRKRRDPSEFGDFAKFKLGEDRRKQLKSAISDRCKESLAARDSVRAIGKVKEATLPQLFAMAETIGLLDFALELVDDRVDKKIRAKATRLR